MFAGPWKSALDLGAYTIKHNIHRIYQLIAKKSEL